MGGKIGWLGSRWLASSAASGAVFVAQTRMWAMVMSELQFEVYDHP